MMIPKGGLLVALASVGIVLSGCQSLPPSNAAQLSPLEVRALQTRAYDGNDSKIVMKTVMNVLQDEGFLIDYGNTDLGLLHASVTLTPSISDRWLGTFSVLNEANRPLPPGSSAKVDATVNVSSIGGRVQIRVSFQKTLTNPSANYWWFSTGPTSAATVTNPKAYQEFFAKLEQGFFIQKQGL
jgi:hypothetical protein